MHVEHMWEHLPCALPAAWPALSEQGASVPKGQVMKYCPAHALSPSLSCLTAQAILRAVHTGKSHHVYHNHL